MSTISDVVNFFKNRSFLFCLLLLVGLGYLVTKVIFIPERESHLEVALRVSKSNRKELEKVLRRYQFNAADSLKYKAACFLIENMPYYYYRTGEQYQNYLTYYSWLKDDKNKGIHPSSISDSVIKAFGPIGQPAIKYDIQEIDSAYLCHNIDWAFKVWQEQPWGKNVSFETFCEYLLPYRIEDETLAYWREEYYEKYNPLLDSLRLSDTLDKEDPIVAVRYLMNQLKDSTIHFTSVTPIKFPHIGPQYAQLLTGTCRELTDFSIYVCRALGIPCAVDYVSVHWKLNAGHFWAAYWDKNGELYLGNYPSNPVLVRKDGFSTYVEKPKAYRHTFSLNREVQEQMAESGEEIHPTWKNPRFIDVTYSYTHSYIKNLEIPQSKIYPTKKKASIAYLCCSLRKDWIPVDWAKYKEGNLVFHQVQKGAIMRVATYEEGKLCFLTDPFYMDRLTNELHFYSSEGKKRDVTLFAKYNLDSEEGFLRDRMIGGVFEGSNDPDFSEKDTLYIIQEKPFRLNTNVQVQSDKKYRYVRYFGAEHTCCNIAEVAFRAWNDTVTLKGKVIGTPGCFQGDGSHEYTNVFDGKSWTSFDYLSGYGGWAGLDLGTPVRIGNIIYTPRNRDNYIRPGDEFELFYCQDEWVSAGRVRAESDSLYYKDIPENSILLVVNHSNGVQERIFTYENKSQIWK